MSGGFALCCTVDHVVFAEVAIESGASSRLYAWFGRSA